jgi:hypothetical protein
VLELQTRQRSEVLLVLVSASALVLEEERL